MLKMVIMQNTTRGQAGKASLQDIGDILSLIEHIRLSLEHDTLLCCLVCNATCTTFHAAVSPLRLLLQSVRRSLRQHRQCRLTIWLTAYMDQVCPYEFIQFEGQQTMETNDVARNATRAILYQTVFHML